MKTEDIDKRIGMPDVDAEWARFEQKVIGKEPKTNKRSVYSWMGGLGIAACLLLFFLINMGDEPKPAIPVVAEQTEPQPLEQPATEEDKEEPIAHIVNTPQPKKASRKELAAANVDAPATMGLKISHREYSGKVQKQVTDDLKNLAFESVDQELQGQIAGFDNLPPQVIKLGSGYVIRNLGYKYRIPEGEPLLLFNGELLPDSVKQTLNNREIGHLDRFFLDFFEQRHQRLEKINVLKDEETRRPYTEKFGDLAQDGVINITTSPDTLCDYYMNRHEELKASRYRISGIVLDENKKPLPHTMIAVVKEGNKIWGCETADSTGHFAFWAPRTGVKISFSYVGFYKAVEVEPTDKPLTIRMKLTKDAKKLKKELSFE
ncbi:MAG: carboxypeptidase-like regulatory domain-containing protein [Bacteroidaceae bacterium]|nr:carboxypeptidase-like regulatory domain-containing protein [Bacteroidaceae bacterium]